MTKLFKLQNQLFEAKIAFVTTRYYHGSPRYFTCFQVIIEGITAILDLNC